MRIFLVDDQTDVRSALRLLLEQEPGYEVVAEACDCEELRRAMSEKPPDLWLLDWELPGQCVAAAIPLLRRCAKVIVLSSRPEVRQEALAAGADAFVSKVDTPEHVLATIQSVLTPA